MKHLKIGQKKLKKKMFDLRPDLWSIGANVY
jgi:hypothetical protein